MEVREQDKEIRKHSRQGEGKYKGPESGTSLEIGRKSEQREQRVRGREKVREDPARDYPRVGRELSCGAL